MADLTSRYVADPSTVDVVGSLQGFAKAVVRAWWSLADFLVFRYADGYDNVPNAGSSVGEEYQQNIPTCHISELSTS